MITTSTNFIKEFHNLQGDKIGLRKQHLYNILRTSILSPDEQQLLVQNLHPKNYLEIVFHADVLIYFKLTSALFELLKNGNEIYVSKITKQRWFFEELFKNVPPSQLVEEVLPTLSFSVKVKLLKKLQRISLPEHVDKIFDSLWKRYGLYLASRVLTGCSVQKIKNILKSHDIQLSTGDLKLLHKKDFSIIETYFEEKKSRKYDELCTENFYKYLAENDPKNFWKIFKNYKPTVNLGRRITKKVLINIEKQDIINDPKTFINCFKNERMVRIMNNEKHLFEFYKNLYPDEIADFKDEETLKEILKYCPKRKRGDLFKTTFEQVYNEDVLKNFKFIDPPLLELIGESHELRTKLAHLKFDKSGSAEYLGYYAIKEGISLITERIDMTSQLTGRNKLLNSLLTCCAVNKDMTALERVLKYFCDRHRNEIETTRDIFLQHFRDYFQNISDKFTDDIWKYIIEIITIQFINDEYGVKSNENLIAKYITFLHEKNYDTEIDNVIAKFLPKLPIYYLAPEYEEHITNINLQKKVTATLYKLSNSFIKTVSSEDKMRRNYIFHNIHRVLQFNKKYPQYRIKLNEDMQADIRDFLQEDNINTYYSLSNTILLWLCRNDLDDFEAEIKKLVWKHLFKDYMFTSQIKFIEWHCIHQPTTIAPHLDTITKMFLNTPHLKIFKSFKPFSHLGYDDVLKKSCLSDLSDNDSLTSLLWLSHLLSTEDYRKLGHDFNLFPEKMKLDTSDLDTASKFKLQKSFLEKMKNTPNPSEYLPLILEKYCQGDFMQSSLPPLYKAFYRIPEDCLRPYLKTILERKSISLSKHAAVFACNLFEQSTVIKTLNNIEKVENTLLKKGFPSVLRSILKYFCKSPTTELFDIVLRWLQFVTEDNVESLKYLFTIKIDKCYQEKYFQEIWKLIKDFKNNSELISIKGSCLKSLNATNFEKLTNDFCKEIIQNHFLNEPEVDEIYTFVINFLLLKKDENTRFVFQIISGFKTKYWSDYKPSKTKKVNNFIKAVVDVANKKQIELELLETFINNWQTVFLPHEAFEEHLLLQFVVFWAKSSNSLETFASQIMHYLAIVRVEYIDIIPNFASALSQFLDFKDEKLRLNLLECLMETADVTLASYLVMELIRIKNDFICNDRIKKTYLKVDVALKQALDNNSVMLKYNLLLGNC